MNLATATLILLAVVAIVIGFGVIIMGWNKERP